MQVPNHIKEGRYLHILRTINARTTMTATELDKHREITTELIEDLYSARLIVKIRPARGAHIGELAVQLTPEGVSFLMENGAEKEISSAATKPATTIADIITAVSQRSVLIDQDTKRTMTALRNRLGLSSLEDVLTVALHLTTTLLDALPSDGVLRMVNEDGESIQTLKITP